MTPTRPRPAPSDAKLLHSSVRTSMSTNCGTAADSEPVVTFAVTKLEICDLYGDVMIRFAATRVNQLEERAPANRPKYRPRR